MLVAQSCPTLCDPVDCSPPGSFVREIPPGKNTGKVKSLSRIRLFATPWTVAYWAPPSMGFSRQRYWSGLPFPSPEDLPDPGIEIQAKNPATCSKPSLWEADFADSLRCCCSTSCKDKMRGMDG